MHVVVHLSSMPGRSRLSMKWLEAPLSAVMVNSTGCVAMLIGDAAMEEEPIPAGGEDG